MGRPLRVVRVWKYRVRGGSGGGPAWGIYVRKKGIACEQAGMFNETVNLPAGATQDELIEVVRRLNADDRFHGILVQLPLPPQIEERAVIQSIDPDKDVDGTEYMDTAVQALKKHATQVTEEDAEVHMRQWRLGTGKKVGFQYAEAFKVFHLE